LGKTLSREQLEVLETVNNSQGTDDPEAPSKLVPNGVGDLDTFLKVAGNFQHFEFDGSQ